MATSRTRIDGLKELGAALKSLGDEVGSKIGRSAVGKGAGVVKKAVKQRAPVADEPYEIEGVRVEPGNIGKNVVTKRVKASETNLTVEYVVAIRGKRKHGYANRVAILQEFGTVNMEANAFVRPAYEESKEPAAQQIVGTLQKQIDKANKAAK
jgi:HK97 gp10 family phage protein